MPRRATLRSGLAALGIVMGVAAVVAMVAVGQGARASIEATLSRFDSGRLRVSALMPAQPPFDTRPDVPANDGLRIDDVAAVRASMMSDVRTGLQVATRASRVRVGSLGSGARIIGVESDGLLFESRRVIRGDMFGDADVRFARPVCLLSAFLADLLFAGIDPIGKSVSIGDASFSVLGIVNDVLPRDPSRSDVGDASIYVPYSSVTRRLDRNASISFSVRTEKPLLLGGIESRIAHTLEQRRGSRKAEFVITNFSVSIEAHKESTRTMTMLLGAIACISLLVGGIGIMNIMLVSVVERTREIGLRIAIGTRKSDVLRQFLFESVVLCILGGAVGIVLGVAAALLMSRLNGWPTLITPQSVVIAFLVSVGTGVLCGYAPARRAANLEPILALKAE